MLEEERDEHGGMLIIVLVCWAGSVALAATVLAIWFASSSVCVGAIWRSVVLLSAVSGIWMSCGMLFHCMASLMNPRMHPWRGWFVLMGVWKHLMLCMRAGVLSGWRMMSRAKGGGWSEICSKRSWFVSVEVGPRRMVYVRSTAWASAKVRMPAVVAASGPCGGPWGGRGKFAAPGLPVSASSSSSGSSKLSAATARLSRLNRTVVMLIS